MSYFTTSAARAATGMFYLISGLALSFALPPLVQSQPLLALALTPFAIVGCVIAGMAVGVSVERRSLEAAQIRSARVSHRSPRERAAARRERALRRAA